MWKSVLFTMLLLVSKGSLLAHSGGTNAAGCHTNRKTGDYHCHNSGSSPSTTSASRASSPAPPAEPPVIRRATPEEISASPRVPSSFLPQFRPEPPPEKIEFVDTRKRPGDGFEVIRPNPPQLVRMAQLLLRALKFEIKDKDGELGYSTILAIRNFQALHNSIPDGRVSPELLLKLAETIQTACEP